MRSDVSLYKATQHETTLNNTIAFAWYQPSHVKCSTCQRWADDFDPVALASDIQDFLRWSRQKRLSQCGCFYAQSGLTCEWCWRVRCILLSGICGLTWSVYVGVLAESEKKLSLHQACAKQMIDKLINEGSDARRSRNVFNRDEIANETLTK